jgi:hypothetical protein
MVSKMISDAIDPSNMRDSLNKLQDSSSYKRLWITQNSHKWLAPGRYKTSLEHVFCDNSTLLP